MRLETIRQTEKNTAEAIAPFASYASTTFDVAEEIPKVRQDGEELLLMRTSSSS